MGSKTLAVLAIAAMMVGSCASDTDGSSDSTPPAGTNTDAVEKGGDVFTPTVRSDADSPSLPDQGTVSDSVLDPIEPVADTGVPGIESDDAFCRSWSEFAGSYQALTFAWAFQADVDAARLEVIASNAMLAAVDELSRNLPEELEVERQELSVDLPTPILRRAQRAREILVTNVRTADVPETLGALWLDALTEQGLETETFAVSIDDPELSAAIDRSAMTLLAELPPITEDPSLIVEVDISLTEEYLFDNCPDRGVLAGNDNVDP